ncbi:MAG: cytochrome c oxidase assembly protein, partial [Nitrococcus sp.]|nr:cytochrome c oxidase assembly protein [Nitrococcus sp.]
IFFSHQELFDIYSICGRAWPISPIVDQQIGGLVTWIPASMMSVVGAVILLSFMFREHRVQESQARVATTAPAAVSSAGNPISTNTLFDH